MSDSKKKIGILANLVTGPAGQPFDPRPTRKVFDTISLVNRMPKRGNRAPRHFDPEGETRRRGDL